MTDIIHHFAGSVFNRLSERRSDAQWLQAALNSPDTLVIPLWQGRSLIAAVPDAPQLACLQMAQLPNAWREDHARFILLGELRDQPVMAMNLPDEAQPWLEQQQLLANFHDLRSVGGQLAHEEAGLLGYARALVLWHQRHRYCGHCGSPTHPTQAGHVLMCSAATCGQQTFPRLDPAIIVLVTRGEQALLGRQASWPEQRYSTIAGYVEWGESIEEAVRREVFEEAGVQVGVVRYHSSQPWPFPSSLMLGFTAQAITQEIVLRDGELADARWFSRADIHSGAFTLPPPWSISRQLIEQWLRSDD